MARGSVVVAPFHKLEDFTPGGNLKRARPERRTSRAVDPTLCLNAVILGIIVLIVGLWLAGY